MVHKIKAKKIYSCDKIKYLDFYMYYYLHFDTTKNTAQFLAAKYILLTLVEFHLFTHAGGKRRLPLAGTAVASAPAGLW